jgi:predicted amidohydrolase YtcJ
MPVYSDESLEKAIEFAKKKGCQISVHAMGGRAIDRIVDRMEKEEDWTDGGAPYLRIEHLTEPSDAAMEKAARKGFAFASQPIFEYCEIETYKANMDAERLKRLYPHRTELLKGVKLCLSTDAPATSWAVPSEPFSNLKSAVTRKAYDGTDIGQGERLDIETAITLYTKNAAEVCGFAGLGMLKEGYSADFAVLDRDIFTIEPEHIDEVKVQAAYIEGEKAF